jgi:hypothetical protein
VIAMVLNSDAVAAMISDGDAMVDDFQQMTTL